MAKKLLITILIIALLIGGAFAAYWFIFRDDSQPVLSIEGYYDKDGRKISSGLRQQAVIAETGQPTQYRVRYIRLTSAAENTIDVPLTFEFSGITPTPFATAMVASEGAYPHTKVANAGTTATWISDLIDVEQFTSLSQPTTFTVSIEGTNPDKTPVAAKLGSIVVTITPDAEVDFDVTLVKEYQDY